MIATINSDASAADASPRHLAWFGPTARRFGLLQQAAHAEPRPVHVRLLSGRPERGRRGALIALTSMSSGTCTSQPGFPCPLAKASAVGALDHPLARGRFLFFISTPFPAGISPFPRRVRRRAWRLGGRGLESGLLPEQLEERPRGAV